MMSLSPEVLIAGYCQGFFPMGHEDGQIRWYDPDPRAIIPLEGFHVPRSLKRRLKRDPFEIRINTAFEAVIRECAAPRPDGEGTWITEEIVVAYLELHRLGFAHCVESWHDDQLVGGLYGVAIGGFFAGESMFSLIAGASSVALVHLVERLRHARFALLDVQFSTQHLRRFGAVEIPRSEYKVLLRQAVSKQVIVESF